MSYPHFVDLCEYILLNSNSLFSHFFAQQIKCLCLISVMSLNWFDTLLILWLLKSQNISNKIAKIDEECEDVTSYLSLISAIATHTK